MKKILISLFVLVSLTAIIPIVGNRLVKDTLDTKIKNLESKGIKVQNASEDVTYLNTSKHYEFLVEDTLVGVDLKYSNIPLSEDISLDIYPLALCQNIMNDLVAKDKEFAKHIEDFLLNRGILYHINYNIISTDFNGFVKDVNEKHTLKNNAKVALNISQTKFEGSGDLIAPSYLNIFSKKTMIKIINPNEEVSLDVNNFSLISKFENKSTYSSSANLDSLVLNLKAPNSKKETIDISKIYLNLSSNTQGEKAELTTKLSFDDMQVKLKDSDLNASLINYDITVSQMDKHIYEELRVMLSKSKLSNSEDLASNMREATIRLLSKGIKINIKDLSLKNINLNGEDLKGLSIKSDMKLDEDKNFALKMMISPLLILPSIDLDFKSKVSKKILSEIVVNSPLPISILKYSTSAGDEAILDIYYKQGSLKINGTSILN